MSDVVDKIQLEGLSDFSKLIEVLRAKYIDEKSFVELKTNEEKVRFCLEKEEVQSSFASFIKTCFGERSNEPKSAEKCQSYRQEGNKCFRAKKFQEALHFYSKVSGVMILYPSCLHRSQFTGTSSCSIFSRIQRSITSLR